MSINHVIVITFTRFERAVNDIGCVYSTVDRRYYHVNVPGGEQYQEINLQPGYQRMCGGDALSFVSYRHGDTSLVRDTRDQSFLLDVKRQYGPTLVDNADNLRAGVKRLQADLARVVALLEEGKSDALKDWLDTAAARRQKLLVGFQRRFELT